MTAEQVERFREEGYIIIRKLLTEQEIAKIQRLRERIESDAASRGAKENFSKGKADYDLEPLSADPAGKTIALRKVQEVYLEEPDFAEVAASEKILDVAEDLIGTEIYYHSSKLMFKPAGGGRRKPWHQDWAYWSHMTQKQVTVWMAIDEATRENGCIQLVPGSHKRGLVEHHHGEDFMIDEDQIDPSQIAYAEMKPGDVLFFDVLMLHASDPNRSDKPRLSCIIDFDSQPRPAGDGLGYGSTTPLRSVRMKD